MDYSFNTGLEHNMGILTLAVLFLSAGSLYNFNQIDNRPHIATLGSGGDRITQDSSHCKLCLVRSIHPTGRPIVFGINYTIGIN